MRMRMRDKDVGVGKRSLYIQFCYYFTIQSNEYTNPQKTYYHTPSPTSTTALTNPSTVPLLVPRVTTPRPTGPAPPPAPDPPDTPAPPPPPPPPPQPATPTSRGPRGRAAGLVVRGFMVDYARVDGRGRFLRVVVNRGTRRGTVEGLVRAVVEVGEGVW